MLDGHKLAVRNVAFADDDRLLASGSEDQTVQIWNVASHDLRGTFTGHTAIVSAVTFVQTNTGQRQLGPHDSSLGRRRFSSSAQNHALAPARSSRWRSPRTAAGC